MTKCCASLVNGMDKRVSIQAVTQTSDGQGGFTESWTTSATVWASIEPLKGWERMQAMQVQTPVTHKLVMRYRSGVSTGMRILYKARVFAIKEVINEMEQDRFLIIKAIEQQ